jgi:hypothetical protein
MQPSNFDFEQPNFVPISPNVPPLQAFPVAPSLSNDLAVLIAIRDTALRAYLKALKAGKEYLAEGMSVKRYDLDALKKHYIDARDEVDNILRHGNSSTMVYKRIIPMDY